MKVLLGFNHGYGDSVQLGCVLQHLKHYHPDWHISVKLPPERWACVQQFAKPFGESAPYDQQIDMRWNEPFSQHISAAIKHNVPASKVTRCLVDDFKLKPLAKFYRYHINYTKEDLLIAKRSLRPHFRPVLIHYSGNSSRHNKNIDEITIKALSNWLIENNATPLILDFDNRCGFYSAVRINRQSQCWEGETPTCQRLAALIESCEMFMGIDSGPLHVAGATNTFSIGIWTNHHPAHFYDLCSNVTHLVPQKHENLIRTKGDERKSMTKLFEKLYTYRCYDSLQDALIDAAKRKLGPRTHRRRRNKLFV